MDQTAKDLLSRHGRKVGEYLQKLRSRFADAPRQLWDTVDYSVLAGGKRLRPALVLETYSALGTQHSALADRSALACAGAIELIHTFSLVHDDLPAMDDDDLRR